MQAHIHSPDSGGIHGRIDDVDTFVIGISFLGSAFGRTITRIASCWGNEFDGLFLMT